LWFIIALVAMLTAYITLLDIGTRGERQVFAAAAVLAIITSLALYRRALPRGKLGHRGRRRREERQRAAVMGVLAAVLIVMLYAAALALDSWAAWVGVGIVFLGAIGAVLAVPANPPEE
jgi:uncharacterized membrane protein YidH (DUF202 family)